MRLERFESWGSPRPHGFRALPVRGNRLGLGLVSKHLTYINPSIRSQISYTLRTDGLENSMNGRIVYGRIVPTSAREYNVSRGIEALMFFASSTITHYFEADSNISSLITSAPRSATM